MKTLYLADLVGTRVFDVRGKHCGNVAEVIVDRTDRFRIVAVEVGTSGWLDRLNIVGTIQRRRKSQALPRIPWRNIASVESGRITLDVDKESLRTTDSP